MQVGLKIKVRSELHTWRQFLARSTLWLGVWLLGAAVICGVAANWEKLTITQRFLGTECLLAICAITAAWLGWRLRADDGPRRYVPDALLALAGLLLGALLALLGQTYQTGADTWELFAWWGVLLLPWALVAMSQAVWLLWMAVINIAIMLYTQQGSILWWDPGSTGQMLPLAIVNLLFLAGWEVAGKRWSASTILGPRLLAAWLIGLTVTVLFFDNGPLYGLGSGLALLWIAMTVGLGVYYLRVRRDLVTLAVLAAGVIGMSLRVVGAWWLDTVETALVALPLAGLLIGEAVLTAGWLRRLAADGHVEPAPTVVAPAEPSSSVVMDDAPTTLDADSAAPRLPREPYTPWYVQGLLALSAWLATLLLLLFVVAVEMVTTGRGAVITGGVLCAVAVAALRGTTGLFGRQCLTALGFAGQLLVLFGLLFSNLDVSAAAGIWLSVLALGAAVYVLGSEVLLRFLSAGMMALALGALMIQLLVPEALEHDWWVWLDMNTRAIGLWLPVAVMGAWAATIAFYLGYFNVRGLHGSASAVPADSSARAAQVGQTAQIDQAAQTVQSGQTLVSQTAQPDQTAQTAGRVESRDANIAFGVTPGRAGFESLRPLAWAFALAVQAMVWMAGGVSLSQIPPLWRANAWLTLIIVAGVLLPVACAMAVLWPRRQALTPGVVWGVPLGLLVLALFWLPSPGVAFALTWALLGVGLRDLRLLAVGGISLLVYLVVYYYQMQIPLLDKAFWLAGAALLLFVLRALVYLVPRWTRTIELPAKTAPAPASTALRWRTAVVLGGLVLVLGVVNYTIWQREVLLATGRTVILELAPVDPRSLMQGDYMALNFAVGESLRPRFGSDQNVQASDGYVVLAPDSNGVAQVARIQADTRPVTGEEIALRYRIRDRDVRIVTNAYFFPEGQADRYAAARYGEVRVGEDGTGLLVRMLGIDHQPLKGH